MGIPPEMTVDEAVAMMLNFEPPIYHTLFDAIAAYTEQDIEYFTPFTKELKNADLTKTILMASRARLEYALALHSHMMLILSDEKKDILVKSTINTGVPKVTTESLAEWAHYYYGIGWKRFDNYLGGDNQNTPEIIEIENDNSESITHNKLYVVLGYFIALLAASLADFKKKSSQEINCSEVARTIEELVQNDVTDKNKRTKLSFETIRKIVSEAIEARKTYVHQINND